MIGALSCWKYQERRERCVQTWMQEGDKLDGTSPGEHIIVRSVFLIGIPEIQVPELDGRYLLLPGPSDYRSLPQRIRAFCQWAISRDDWDYLFKCADDTYVSIPRLVRYPLTADYIGRSIRRRDRPVVIHMYRFPLNVCCRPGGRAPGKTP